MGERIRLLRETRGLSRYALAYLIHCEPISIMLWEDGNTTPTLRMICRLADFFKVDTDYIINGGGDE